MQVLMQQSVTDKITNEEFENNSNYKLAKIHGISRETIRRLRIKRKIEKNKDKIKNSKKDKNKKERDELILNFIKTNNNKISVKNVKKSLKIRITQQEIKKLADDNNLEITFCKNLEDVTLTHGVTMYKHGCKCNVCKLSNCLKTRFSRMKIFPGVDVIAGYANLFIKQYEEDLDYNKKKFYSFFDEKIGLVPQTTQSTSS